MRVALHLRKYGMPHRVPTLRALASGVLVMAVLAVAACGRITSQTDQELLQRGEAFQAQGKLASAVIEFRNALQKNPKNAEARQRLGEIYVNQGLGEEAEKELGRAKELGVDFESLKVPMGQALLLQGLYQRVLSEIQPGPKSSSSDVPKILEIRGRAQLGLLHFDEGCKLFAQSLESDPRYVPSHWGLARCAQGRGKLDEARTELDKALQLEPENSGTWTRVGDSERLAKRLPEAETAYTSALRFKNSDLNALLGRAIVRIDSNKLDDANQDLDAAFRLVRGNPLATHLRGVIQFKRGRVADAKISFETVLKTIPNDPSAVFWLGLADLSLHDYEQAAKQFAQFSRTVPNVIEVQALLALAQARMGRKKEAAETLRVLRNVNIEDPQSLAMLGQARLAIGESTLAEAAFKKAVEDEPKAANLRIGLAASLLQQGERSQAIEQLERAVDLDPAMTGADVLLIKNYIRNRRFDKALVAIGDLEKKEPRSSTVLNLKGAAFLAKGDYASARASFEQAFALDPPSVAAAMNLAQIDLAEKRAGDARERFQAILAKDKTNVRAMVGLAAVAGATGDEAEYAAWLEKAAKAGPGVLGPRIALANYYLRKKDLQRSLAIALEAQTVSPENPQALDVLGTAQLAAGDNASAAATYRKLAKVSPEDPVVHYKLATTEASTRDASAAEASLKKALELKPDFFDAEMLLVAIELRTGEYGEALKLAQQIKKQFPQSAVGLTLEGDVLMAQRQFGSALKSYDRAFALEKTGMLVVKQHQALVAAGDRREGDRRILQWLNEEPKDRIARAYLASTYLAMGQRGPAIEQLQLLLQNDPKNASALNDLAWLYHQEGDARALPTAQQAYQLQPSNVHAMDTLGWILLAQGETGRALELLHEATSQAPASTAIRYHWAVALAKSGNKSKARSELADLLTSNKDFPEKIEAQALLKQLQL